jgi:predicted transcriptional regulator
MTGLEAIPKISALTIQLIERVKDSKTAILVTQIQTLNQTVQASHFAAEKELSKLRAKIAKMKAKHAKKVRALKSEHIKQITDLKQQISLVKERYPQPGLNHNF